MMNEQGIDRENLQKLATGLMYDNRVIDVDFNMGSFTLGYDNTAPYCETAGCAVGFGPFFGIEKLPGEHFGVYSQRAFIDHGGIISVGNGVPFGWQDRGRANGAEWDWCFSGEWTAIDNTRSGAAKRIQYFLDHGLPEGFSGLYGDSGDNDWTEVYTGIEVKR